MQVAERSGAIMEAARRLSQAGVAAEDIAVRRPTLDDVFLSLTGQAPAEETDETTTARAGGRMISDTLTLAERALVRLPRNPDMLLAFTVQPIMFVLLFAFVFGGAIETPGYGDYIDFLIPGMIVQQIAFGGFATALGLAEDMTKGLIDRFRSLPTARASVLAGRTLADVATNLLSVAILLATGFVIGFRFDASVPEILGRHRPAAAVRLRLQLDLRGDRDERVLAGGGERRRLHPDLPDHVHLVRVRAGRVDAGGPAPRRRGQPGLARWSTRSGRCGSAATWATACG